MPKRLFIAVKVYPQPVLSAFIRKLQNHLKGEAIKWVEEYNLHLTLKFLGETDESAIGAIEEKLESVCRGFGPFGFKLEGIGHFGQRVLFINLSKTEKLGELASRVGESLAWVNSGSGSQPFKAHLTLGRIKFLKSKTTFSNLIKTEHDTFFQDAEVKEVILYESILKPQGPVYQVVRKFPL